MSGEAAIGWIRKWWSDNGEPLRDAVRRLAEPDPGTGRPFSR
jgi:hypothetical protein